MQGQFYFYPQTPGFKDRTTSQDAAIKMLETGAASRYRQKCLEALKDGPATPKELAARIGADKDCVRPRLTTLLLEGLIERIGRRDGQHILALVNKQ